MENEKSKQIYLSNINEYPATVDKPGEITIANPVQRSSIQLTRNIFSSKENDIISEWYCNRGFILLNRSLEKVCLCPPSYYGARCEYQSERLLVTLRIDIPISLSRYRNDESTVRLAACLMFNQTIVYSEQFLHAHGMKQIFYLNYPRPPPKMQG